MKKIIIVLFFSIASFSLFCQTFDKNAKYPFFFNEFNVSVNYSAIGFGEYYGKFGFGLNAYRVMFKEKKLNLLTGIEYNLTRQFWADLHIYGYLTNYKDVTFCLGFISIPLNFRINFGQNIKIFLELGAYIEFCMHATYKGRYSDNGHANEFKKGYFIDPQIRYGFSGGIGVRIPVNKYEIIIKPDYKFGLPSNIDGPYNRYIRLNFGFAL
jgi:hypothetical protein